MKAAVRRRARESAPDLVFDLVNRVLLWTTLVVVLYPLVYVVSASVSSGYAVVSNQVWLWPVDFTLTSYGAILKHGLLVSGYLNSVLYVVAGTLVNLSLLLLAAYPLSRPDLPARRLFSGLFLFVMFFNGGIIPNYLLVRSLGMLDTRWALIVPAALSVYNIMVARTYFQTNIPQELLEASQMDGCTDLRFFSRVVLPLSGPIVAVMALFHAVDHWNGYFRGLIYLSNPRLYPLQLVLRDILFITNLPEEVLSQMDDRQLIEIVNLQELLKYAIIVAGSLPMLVAYPFVQKYFVRGVLLGSIKG
jgi:multiple sugar transport system permease protein/putative aldouronate transport system permease protein